MAGRRDGEANAGGADVQMGSDEDEDAQELDIALDDEGRIAGFSHAGLNFGFRTFPKAIDSSHTSLIQKIQRDCLKASSARSSKGSGNYSEGNTFWITATDKPRCLLEQLAQEIFNFHTSKVQESKFVVMMDGKEITFNADLSGAEFWCLHMDQEDAVGWHWDKDYSAESDGVNIHPHIGTVTYFCESGAPTVFLEKCVGSPIIGSSIAGKIETGYISWPRMGKHVSFDGRWLHGAPEELKDALANSIACEEEISKSKRPQYNSEKKDLVTSQKRSSKNQKNRPAKKSSRTSKTNPRITFLVNIWLNHKPEYAKKMPKNLASKLSPALRRLPLTFDEAKLRSYRKRRLKSEVRHSTKKEDSLNALNQKYRWPIAQGASEMKATLELKIGLLSAAALIENEDHRCMLFSPADAQVIEKE
mmetsp:Transcript_33042/g.80294  ORF Transcript_33042/g.80294 Transcript_33042/m.80294 type:complete len:418 (-) Transcript_33042:240-1493(-)|eukprot:CAMPEP_0114519028 /NCGR_PEP_ID=MMETSP0109-20121206/18772_1 /TAXON_ID=29199 /ORGANISM="Chlorarachnion reptans, Strain CCCM449" /LENGTH=417 /DNA_ID=CAMNT_0001699715 /DNA_START=35 /DNA_END=1288 /DNA_ORIENTATION=+